MIKAETIIAKINELPDNLKQEVLHYIDFLQEKFAMQNQNSKRRQAGSAKGKYKLAPDFDLPLEDFKDYM